MAVAAIPLILTATAAAASAQVMASREAARAAKFESEGKQREGEECKTAAAQAEARRREQLVSSLENIASIRADRGVGAGSPTAMAAYEEIISDESRDVRTERYNYLSRAEQAHLASKMANRKARMSLIAGYTGAGATLLSAGAKIAGGGEMGARRY